VTVALLAEYPSGYGRTHALTFSAKCLLCGSERLNGVAATYHCMAGVTAASTGHRSAPGIWIMPRRPPRVCRLVPLCLGPGLPLGLGLCERMSPHGENRMVTTVVDAFDRFRANLELTGLQESTVAERQGGCPGGRSS
jgi:hypothetical protein